MALEDDVRDMVREIERLVETLRDLGRTPTAGRTSRETDQLIRAMAQMTATLNQNNRSKRQETASVEQFIRQVKSATTANDRQAASSEDVTEANRDQIRSIEDVTDAQRANEAALRAYRAEQEKNRNFASILAREKLAEARANRTLTSYLEQRAGQDVEAQMRLQRTIAAMGVLGDVASKFKGFAGQLAQGNTSFSTLNPVVDALAKVIGNVVGMMPFIGNALQGLADGAAEGFKFLIGQLDTATQTFNQLAQTGALTEQGITGVQQQFLQSGLSLDAYRQIVTENASALARFGGTVGRGTTNFTEFLGSIVDSDAGMELRRLGFSADQIGESAAAFLTQQTRLGLSQRRSQEELRQGSIQYAQELDRLAKLTGMQRKEIQAQQDAALSEARFRAVYDDMVASGQETQAKTMLDFQTMVSKASPEMAQGLRDMASGLVNSDASIKLFTTTGGAAAGIMQQVKTGQIDQVTAFKMLQDATRQQMGVSRELAKAVGDETNRFVAYGQQSDLVNAKIVDGQVQLLDHQKKQMAQGTDPLTDSAVDAQKNLQQMSRQLANFAFAALPAAGAAVSGFTDVLNRGIQAIAQATGIELKNLGGQQVGAAAEPGPGQATRPRIGSAAPQAIAPAAPAPPGMGQTAESLAQMGLRIKQGDVQVQGNAVSPKIIEMAKQIQKLAPGFQYFSSFNDRFHNENVPGSFHTRGQALDFTVDPAPTIEQGRQILRMLNNLGADYARDEYNFPSSNSTAGHFHAHIREFARGGIARGPDTGYAATLHGAEAVVPLPDGRTIPVKIEMPEIPLPDGRAIPRTVELPEIRNPFAEMSEPMNTPDFEAAVDRMGQQIRTAMEDMLRAYRSNPAMESALQELVNLQRSNNSTTERLLQVSVN